MYCNTGGGGCQEVLQKNKNFSLAGGKARYEKDNAHKPMVLGQSNVTGKRGDGR